MLTSLKVFARVPCCTHQLLRIPARRFSQDPARNCVESRAKGRALHDSLEAGNSDQEGCRGCARMTRNELQCPVDEILPNRTDCERKPFHIAIRLREALGPDGCFKIDFHPLVQFRSPQAVKDEASNLIVARLIVCDAFQELDVCGRAMSQKREE